MFKQNTHNELSSFNSIHTSLVSHSHSTNTKKLINNFTHISQHHQLVTNNNTKESNSSQAETQIAQSDSRMPRISFHTNSSNPDKPKKIKNVIQKLKNFTVF